MINRCKQAQEKLADIKKLKVEFDLELEKASRDHTMGDFSQRQDQLRTMIEQLKKSLDIYNLKLRKKIALQHNYSYVSNFKGNLAAAELAQTNVWHIVNLKGENNNILYDYVECSEVDRVIVKQQDGDYFLLDGEGKKISEGYATIEKFDHTGYYIGTGSDTAWVILNRNGDEISSSIYCDNICSTNINNLMMVEIINGWYLSSFSGYTIPGGGPFKSISNPAEGIFIVEPIQKDKISDPKFYLIDEKGEIISKMYGEISSVGNGFFKGKINNPVRYVIVDSQGKEQEEKYRYIGKFHEDRAVVKKDNNKYYYIDNNGIEYGDGYSGADDFIGSRAIIYDEADNCFLIDNNFKKISKDYSNIETYPNLEQYSYKKNGDRRNWYFVNDKGKEIGVECDSIMMYQIRGKVHILANQFKNSYFINQEGKKISVDFQMVELDEGVFRVRHDGACYLLDDSYQLLGVGYNGIEDFNQGLAKVFRRNFKIKHEYIDRNGDHFP